MYIYLAIALLVSALSFGGAWKVQSWRHDSQEKARIEAVAEKAKFDRRTVDNAAEGHEKDKRQIQTEFLVITEKVEHALQTDFYSAGAPACLDDAGVRAYNDAAIGPAATASQPARAVPGLKPSHWWQSGRGHAKTD